MKNVTITKIEYSKLKKQSTAYKKLAGRLFESIISTSPDEVALDFRQTGLYSEKFLQDLENGLRKSSYGKLK